MLCKVKTKNKICLNCYAVLNGLIDASTLQLCPFYCSECIIVNTFSKFLILSNKLNLSILYSKYKDITITPLFLEKVHFNSFFPIIGYTNNKMNTREEEEKNTFTNSY